MKESNKENKAGGDFKHSTCNRKARKVKSKVNTR